MLFHSVSLFVRKAERRGFAKAFCLFGFEPRFSPAERRGFTPLAPSYASYLAENQRLTRILRRFIVCHLYIISNYTLCKDRRF